MTRLKEISREERTAVPAGGAGQGAGTIHPRRRLNALQAIAAVVVIAAMVTLVVWIVPLATSGGEAEDVNPNAGAGSAIIHDDAGNLPTDAEWAAGPRGIFYPEKVASDAGSAPVHDDPWNLPTN
jgi:hypothetical protein